MVTVVSRRVHATVHKVRLDIVNFAEVQRQVGGASEAATTHRTRMWTGQRLDLLTSTGHTYTCAAP